MCVKKDRIVEALKGTGMPEDQAIATQLEIGKISMVGCTSYRDETNKHLMKVLNDARPREFEEARQIAKRVARMLQVEQNARRSSERVAQRFYEEMWRLDHQ